jgi:hypothetical protein
VNYAKTARRSTQGIETGKRRRSSVFDHGLFRPCRAAACGVPSAALKPARRKRRPYIKQKLRYARREISRGPFYHSLSSRKVCSREIISQPAAIVVDFPIGFVSLPSSLNIMIKIKNLLTALTVGAAFVSLSPATRAAAAAHENGSEITVTGEVLDLACYTDHGAHGAKHAGCAEKCISGGLPVGLKGTDGVTYLLIGDHAPANDILAPFAAKTVTVKGKFVSRDGINLLENIEVVTPAKS